MNKGVKAATGEVIGILNSDDFYTSNSVLEKVAAAFEDPNVDAVYGDLQYVKHDDVTRVIRTWRAGKYKKNIFTTAGCRRILHFLFVVTCTGRRDCSIPACGRRRIMS